MDQETQEETLEDSGQMEAVTSLDEIFSLTQHNHLDVEEPATEITDAVEQEIDAEVQAEAEPAKPTESAPAAPTVEEQLKALKAELESIKQSKQVQEPEQKAEEPQEIPLPDYMDNPEEYVQEVTKRATERVRMEAENRFLNLSERNNAEKHADFDEVKSVFLAEMNKNPTLQQQVLNSPDPWAEAYKIGKAAQEVAMAGNPADFRKKIESEMAKAFAAKEVALKAKIRADLLKEMKMQHLSKQPDSMVGRSGSGANGAKIPDYTPLSQMFSL